MDSFAFEAGKGGLKSIVGNPLWNEFLLFELTQIMRQQNDLRFAEALTRLAVGKLTSDDINMFQSRCFVDEIDDDGNKTLLKPGQQYLPDEAKNSIRLMWRNEDVTRHNLRRINELKNTSTFRIEFKAVDKVVGAPSETAKRQALHNLIGLPSYKTQGLPSSLTLQIGVRYMITSNIDVSDGLFNGSTGILRFVELSKGEPHAIYLEFEDPNMGKKARKAREHIMRFSQTIQTNWTPILRTKLTFQTTKKGQAQVNIISNNHFQHILS